MSSGWSGFESKLIDIIKNEYEILHRRRFQMTHDTIAERSRAWIEIASRLPGRTPDVCKSKWYEIRSRYRKVKIISQNKHITSKYLDGSLVFMDKFINLENRVTKSKKKKNIKISKPSKNQLQMSMKKNIKQSLMNFMKDCRLKKTKSKNAEMDLFNTSLVTLDTIDGLLRIKEDDPSQSVYSYVTQAMIETILKARNLHFNIFNEEPTGKALEDESKNPCNACVTPTLERVTLNEKNRERNKKQHYNVSKTNSSLTQCELTQADITSLLNPNEFTCENTVHVSDSESNHFLSHDALPEDDDSTISVDASYLDTSNDIPEIELKSLSSTRENSDDEDLNKRHRNETECVEVEEQKTLNIVGSQMEIDTKKFFTDLGTYVESRFTVEKQKTLRLQIMSLITQAESDLL